MNRSIYRYVKCLGVGMTPESVLTDEDRLAKYKNRNKKKRTEDAGTEEGDNNVGGLGAEAAKRQADPLMATKADGKSQVWQSLVFCSADS